MILVIAQCLRRGWGCVLTQLPVFVTTMWAARRMALLKWEGLQGGGVVWFPDLTVPAVDLSAAHVQHLIPLGTLGIVVPAAVAAGMFANVALAFGDARGGPARRENPILHKIGCFLADARHKCSLTAYLRTSNAPPAAPAATRPPLTDLLAGPCSPNPHRYARTVM